LRRPLRVIFVFRIAKLVTVYLPRLGPAGIFWAVWRRLRRDGFRGFSASLRIQLGKLEDEQRIYAKWVSSTSLTAGDIERLRIEAALLPVKPVFSIIVPVFNVEEKWLRRAIESVIGQIYPGWELCLADDASTEPHVRPILEEYRNRDSRIRLVFRRENGHISRATNSALELASGDYMVLVDNDDEIAPEALLEFAKAINEHGPVDMIYSDQDKISTDGSRFEPFFKPDWSPEYLESCMYTAHLACHKMALVRELGGFRPGFEGAQDYDFVLRFSERASRIIHVPKVLYHWRAIRGSTALSMNQKDYVTVAACKALQEHLQRTGRKGQAMPTTYPACFRLEEEVNGTPLVSIVIPSAGRNARIRGREIDLLANCISSLRSSTTYRNYEIVVVDNDDLRPETLLAVEAGDCKLVHFLEPFNVAAKMNLGARHASGDYLLFLNDDIEIIAADWMQQMLQLAQRERIGAVGAKLFFEDDTLQHVGVTFDDDGLPDHVNRGYPGTYPGYFLSAVGTRNYLAVTGACLMTRRDTFDQVGGFNEAFAINYNDVDYCLKVIRSGRRVVFSPRASLYHFESKTRERSVSIEEIALFKSLWAGMTKADPYYSKMLENKPADYRMRATT
jgi:GT2 family glycosyltransferase